jgi:hypothetical protein
LTPHRLPIRSRLLAAGHAQEIVANGCYVEGAADPALDTFRVVAE